MLSKTKALVWPLMVSILLCYQEKTIARSSLGNSTEEVRKAYKMEEDFYNQTITSGKAYHLKCATICEDYDESSKKYEKVTTTEEVFISQHASHVISDDIEVYMDDHDVFTIDRHDNTITHSLSAMNKVNIKDATIFKKTAQDSLLKCYSISNMGTETVNGNQATHFQFMPNSKQNRYATVSFYIEPQTYIFRKMIFEINPEISKEIKSYNVTILERNSTEVEHKLEDVRSIFLSNKGTLKSPYNKFHLSELSGKKGLKPVRK